ncbi:MAG: hypothetical protein LBE59_00865 [Nevskiaceae bacterium]|nr:hypothetical protein [Nevskiaceae bacterium]
MPKNLLAVAAATVLLPIIAATAEAQNAVTAEAFAVERPTLLSLGFEWRIAGDENRNAAVAVSYRKKGESDWRTGLPMLRMNGERVTGYAPGPSRYGERATSIYDFTAPNMFAGSVLNLEPDTEYETRFVLSDPDGVSGNAEQTATVRTRKTPAPAAGGKVYHVYPSGYKGATQEPAFFSLMAAYYTGADHSDHSIAYPQRVQPGDTILLHAGVYKDDSRNYSGFDPNAAAYGTPFDGTYFLTGSGTPDKPIVIKAAGDGEVIFDGNGNFNLFNLMAANYHYFEGITVRNTEVAFLLGWKSIAGASGFSLVRSRAEDVGRVVQDEWAGSKDFYIANNVFIGRHDPQKLQTWYYQPDIWSKYPGFPAPITSEYAIKVYGQGHVVAHNTVAHWHDGIDFSTYGTPGNDPDQFPSSNDFYNNDITNIADNCIETDGGGHNIRVFNNRCFNSAVGAFSAQPIFGGPVYFYRNLSFSGTAGGPLKLIDTPAGVLIYQNTFIGQGSMAGPVSNVHLRNNLFIGDNWKVPVFTLSTFTNYSTSDYNGFRPNPQVEKNFGWNSPEFSVAREYAKPVVRRPFATLAEYVKAAGQDGHSILLDYDAFTKVTAPDPNDPQRLLDPKDYDFTLVRRSKAIDKGMVLPNITDGFTGRAPDLGAFEYGQPLPHYGPVDGP